MVIEDAIVSRLKADTAIRAKIGKRLRPIALAQPDVRPYVAYYQTVPDDQFDHFAGASTLLKIEFSFDIWADSYTDVQAVSRLIKSSLHYLNNWTIEDITVRLAKHKENTDLSEPPSVGTPNPIKHVLSNYLVLYQEV